MGRQPGQKLMRRRNLPARGTVEQELAYAVQICPPKGPNCVVPLQIAQVQDCKFLLHFSMFLECNRRLQTKDSSVFDSAALCLKNLPAITPQQQGRLQPWMQLAQR